MEGRSDGRIEWIDIYKFFAILLVVVGHATGMFNSYIYQFHMAAFFFISGYSTNTSGKRFGESILKKLFTIILPLFSVIVIGLLGRWVLKKAGVYTVYYLDSGLRASQVVKQFIFSGDVYLQFCGACWFLVVLFGCYLLNGIIFRVCNRKLGLCNILVSVAFYVIGILFVKHQIRPGILFLQFDLIFIAHLYFAVGTWTKKLVQNQIIKGNVVSGIALFVITILLLMWLRRNQVYVEYTTRTFPNPVLNVLSGITGSVFLVLLSMATATVMPRLIKKGMAYVGQNTLSILFFHFIFFKLINAFLYSKGIISQDDVRNVVPNAEIGNRYWWIFTIISMAGSIAAWWILTKVPGMRFMLGKSKDKYEIITNKFNELIDRSGIVVSFRLMEKKFWG